jgi:hypothetical protein
LKGNTKARGVYEWGTGEDIGPTRGEITGDWKRFLAEELHDLFSLLDPRMTTSRTTRYANREIRTGDCGNAYRFLVRKGKGRGTTWKARVWMGERK